MYEAFSRMLGQNFTASQFAPDRYEAAVSYFSWTLHVADAMSEAVATHVRENPPEVMPDLTDPAVIVRTLFNFFGGTIGEADGLELVLLPEGRTSDHPDIIPGKRYAIGQAYLLNACAMMLGVPTMPVKDDKGLIRNFHFAKDYFFTDLAGLERWLPIRAARRANRQ